MKKTIFFIISVLVLSLGIITVGANAIMEVSKNKIKIGNDELIMDYPVYENDGTTYISLRDVGKALNIPVSWDSEKNLIFMDIDHKKINVSDKTTLRKEGLVSDEETAYTIGKALLEKNAGYDMEYETDQRIFYLETDYNEVNNEWIVYQNFKNKDGRESIGSWLTPNITINKDSGEITYINTYASIRE